MSNQQQQVSVESVLLNITTTLNRIGIEVTNVISNMTAQIQQLSAENKALREAAEKANGKPKEERKAK